MRLQSLVITFIQVAIAESITERSGYHGGEVTLPSGANSSWTLTKIEWSIYINNTWIATFQKGKVNVDRLSPYKGRLHLDTSTGDLTIRDLRATDAMEYSVDLIDDKGHDSSNKVKLTLNKQLRKPTIQAVHSNSTYGNCWVELNCSSADEGNTLTWRLENPNVTWRTWSSDGSSAIVFAFANTGQNQVKFTCNSRKGEETTSADYTLTCEEPPTPAQTSCWLVFFIGLFLGAASGALAVFYRETIKSGCVQAKVKVCGEVI